jgi:outer membrane immunogenic protein
MVGKFSHPRFGGDHSPLPATKWKAPNWADVSMNQTVTVGTDGQLVGSTDKTKTGWTHGGGAEYALCDNITVKAEMLWFDLGNVSLRASKPNFDGALDVDQKVEGVIARAGVGYKF